MCLFPSVQQYSSISNPGDPIGHSGFIPDDPGDPRVYPRYKIINVKISSIKLTFLNYNLRGPDRQPPDDPGDPRVYPDLQMKNLLISSIKLKMLFLKSRRPDRIVHTNSGRVRMFWVDGQIIREGDPLVDDFGFLG